MPDTNVYQSGDPAGVKPVFPTSDPPIPTTPPPPVPAYPPVYQDKPQIAKLVPVIIIVVVVLVLAYLGFRSLGAGIGLKNVTLTYWGLWEPDQTLKTVIEKYQNTHPGVKIVYQRQSSTDYRERLTSSLSDNKGPDIFRFHNTWVPMLQNSLSTVPSKVYDLATFQSTFYPVAKSDLVINNKIYGIPLMYDGLALFYNTDIFQRGGKRPPVDWYDLRKIALELTARDELGKIKTAGVALGNATNVDHWQDILSLMMLQNNVDLKNPVGERAASALKFYTVFQNQDNVWDSTLPNSTAFFIQGNLAMYFGPSWRIFDFEEAKRSQNPTLNYAVMPVPQLPETNVTWATYWVEGVSKNSKNQDAAWDFVKYLSQKDTMQALFQSQSQTRKIGEIYSRRDMADMLKSNSVASPFVTQAPNAKSWYLVSRTSDGPTGINTKISKYFEDAVTTTVRSPGDAESALQTAASGVAQVLSTYRVSTSSVGK
jgi:multiple sugar transport system substrate-binding protein